MHRVKGASTVGPGFALVEVLVALLVFSLGIAGGLRAQLGALTATRDTLAQLRAVRALDDLVQRGDASGLASLAPAALPIAGNAAASAHPAGLDDWAAHLEASPLEARLCIRHRGSLIEVAIVWQSSRDAVPPGCAGDAARVVAYMVAP